MAGRPSDGCVKMNHLGSHRVTVWIVYMISWIAASVYEPPPLPAHRGDLGHSGILQGRRRGEGGSEQCRELDEAERRGVPRGCQRDARRVPEGAESRKDQYAEIIHLAPAALFRQPAARRCPRAQPLERRVDCLDSKYE